jgi:hypothetical protein
LRIEWLEGDESNDNLRYRVDYTFWVPETGTAAPLSLSYPRRDLITLVRKKGNWRIAEIIRN